MTCASTILGLMTGAAALSAATAYFFQQNRLHLLRRKLNERNDALVALQEERAALIIKNQTCFSENASMRAQMLNAVQNEKNAFAEGEILRGHADSLTSQLDNLTAQRDRLEADNQSLTAEYRKLEILLFSSERDI